MNSEAEEYKNQLYSELARLGKGLASDKRLEILDLLTQSPKSVDSIARETGLSVANTSRHLQVLKEGRLVNLTRDGNRVIYSLKSSKIGKLVRLLAYVGEDELSEIKTIEQQADNVKGVRTISLSEAFSKRNESVLLDVRPTDEYEAGHIYGAINVPLSELDSHLDKLPKKRKIIVYCRGRLCANSNQAARRLNEQGFNAFSLNNSYQEWRELVEVGNK